MAFDKYRSVRVRDRVGNQWEWPEPLLVDLPE